MLTSEAQKILQTIERRLRPSKAPFAGDTEAFNDWTQLLMRYEHDIVAQAFTAHREAGNPRWPDYYTFRDLLKRVSSMQRHPSNIDAEGCQACNGNGWATALGKDDVALMFEANVIHSGSERTLTDLDTGQTRKEVFIPSRSKYSWAEPCTCPAGQQAERTDLWRKAPGLCHACKGAGWFNHRPDDVERCTNCGGSGIERP